MTKYILDRPRFSSVRHLSNASHLPGSENPFTDADQLPKRMLASWTNKLEPPNNDQISPVRDHPWIVCDQAIQTMIQSQKFYLHNRLREINSFSKTLFLISVIYSDSIV